MFMTCYFISCRRVKFQVGHKEVFVNKELYAKADIQMRFIKNKSILLLSEKVRVPIWNIRIYHKFKVDNSNWKYLFV